MMRSARRRSWSAKWLTFGHSMVVEQPKRGGRWNLVTSYFFCAGPRTLTFDTLVFWLNFGRIVIYQETHQPVKKRHCFLAFTCVSKDSQCPSTVADTCTFRQFTGLPFSKKRRDRVIAVGKCCLLIGDYMSKNQIRWVSDRTTRQIIPFWRSKLGSWTSPETEALRLPSRSFYPIFLPACAA